MFDSASSAMMLNNYEGDRLHSDSGTAIDTDGVIVLMSDDQ
jgi:hypothetical protein